MQDKEEQIKISILGISSVCLSLFILLNIFPPYFYFFECSSEWWNIIWEISMPLSIITAILAVAAII